MATEPYLEEQYELAEPGNPFVIVTKRSKNSNLRRRFKKIVGRAGLQPWPKLFQNMRASRATELVKDFPEHVVTAWMGHSKRIAQKHYLQVTEDDYKQASSNPTQNPTQQSKLQGLSQPFEISRRLSVHEQPVTVHAAIKNAVGSLRRREGMSKGKI